MKPIRYGMIGGGQGAFIGGVHRTAAAIAGNWQLVAGALSSTPEKAKASGAELNLPADRWEAVLNFAFDTGQIEKKMTVAQVWDGSLMPKIYDFDEKKIVEKK